MWLLCPLFLGIYMYVKKSFVLYFILYFTTKTRVQLKKHPRATMNKHRMNESTIFWRTYIKVRVRATSFIYMECMCVCVRLSEWISTDWATDFNLIVRRLSLSVVSCCLYKIHKSVCMCAHALSFYALYNFQPVLQSQAQCLNHIHLLLLLRLYFSFLCVCVCAIQYAEYVFTSSPFLSLLLSNSLSHSHTFHSHCSHLILLLSLSLSLFAQNICRTVK